MAYRADFKFRTTRSMVKRAAKLRRAMGINRSQFGRDALLAYVLEKERQLGALVEIKTSKDSL